MNKSKQCYTELANEDDQFCGNDCEIDFWKHAAHRWRNRAFWILEKIGDIRDAVKKDDADSKTSLRQT